MAYQYHHVSMNDVSSVAKTSLRANDLPANAMPSKVPVSSGNYAANYNFIVAQPRYFSAIEHIVTF